MLEFGQRAGIVRLFSHLSGLRQYLSDLFHLKCTLDRAKTSVIKNRANRGIVQKSSEG